MKDKLEKNLTICSFCRKNQYEVNHLIVGPGVIICNECVSLCHKMNEEEAMKKQEKRIVESIRRMCFSELWGTD